MNCQEDVLDLQNGVDTYMVSWSKVKCLPFNIQKCQKITFTRRAGKEIEATYAMKQEVLQSTERNTRPWNNHR